MHQSVIERVEPRLLWVHFSCRGQWGAPVGGREPSLFHASSISFGGMTSDLWLVCDKNMKRALFTETHELVQLTELDWLVQLKNRTDRSGLHNHVFLSISQNYTTWLQNHVDQSRSKNQTVSPHCLFWLTAPSSDTSSGKQSPMYSLLETNLSFVCCFAIWLDTFCKI